MVDLPEVGSMVYLLYVTGDMNRWHCDICNADYASRYYHNRRYHSDLVASDAVHCPHCQRGFVFRTNLVRHLRNRVCNPPEEYQIPHRPRRPEPTLEEPPILEPQQPIPQGPHDHCVQAFLGLQQHFQLIFFRLLNIIIVLQQQLQPQ